MSRNQPKSLSGIETKYLQKTINIKKDYRRKVCRNQPKSLSGIETLLKNYCRLGGPILVASRNQPKSLSGIETLIVASVLPRDSRAGINLNPYQGLKPARALVPKNELIPQAGINLNPYQGLKRSILRD
jgi:hypothetical protein